MKGHFILLFLFLFLKTALVYGQPIEQLYQDYYQLPEKNLSKRAEILRKIVDRELYRHPNRALKQLDTLVLFYEQLDNTYKIQENNHRMRGLVYGQLTDVERSLYHYKKFYDYLREQDETKLPSQSYFFLDWGNAYFNSNLFESAKRYYREAERRFKKEGNLKGVASIYGNYAFIAFSQKRDKDGIELLQKALRTHTEELRDTFQIAYFQTLIGEYYLTEMKDYEQAKHYSLRGLQLFLSPSLRQKTDFEQFRPHTITASLTLARAYGRQKQADSSLYYLRLSDSLALKNKVSYLQQAITNVSTEVLLDLNRIKKAEAINTVNIADSLPAIPKYSKRFLYGAKIAYILGDSAKGDKYSARYYKERYTYLQKRYDEEVLLAGNLLEAEQKDQMLQKREADLAAEKQLRYTLLIVLAAITVALIGGILLIRQLRQQQRKLQNLSAALQETNNTKELMLSALSHDLRAPFQAIWSSTAQLQSALAQKRLSQVKQHSKTLNKAGRNAYALLDGLMQWVSASKNSAQVKKETVELKPLLEQSLNRLEGLLDIQQIQLNKQLANWRISSDANLLQIILRNLLSNAIRYSPLHGEVRLRTQQDETGTYLEIADEGAGVPDKMLGELQLSSNPIEILKKGGGLGLGLVQRVCKQLGLRVTVHRRQHRGTAFRLYFPTVEELAETAAIVEPQLRNAPKSIDDSLKTQLRPIAKAMAQYEIFESTALLRILPDMEQLPPNAEEWVENVQQAVGEVDDARFQQLLHQILH